MQYIDNTAKLEVIVIGGAVILGVLAIGGFLSYEVADNFDEFKEGVKVGKNVFEASTGVVVVEKIGEGLKNEYETTKELFTEGAGVAKEGYAERSQKYASMWLEIMGSDVYNDGFASVRFDTIEENAEALAKRFKKTPLEYFLGLGEGVRKPFMWPASIDDDVNHIISPFKIRQNLDQTPFANYLRGLAGTSAESLKHFIWTEYDEIPDKIRNWDHLSHNEQNNILKLIYNDELLLEASEAKPTYKTWIIKDRVLNFHLLMKRYNINYN